MKYWLGGDVLNLSYRYATDDWEIDSHTLDGRYRIALGDARYLEPHLSYYTQTEAIFYRFSLLDDEPLPEFAASDFRAGQLRCRYRGGRVRQSAQFGEPNGACAWNTTGRRARFPRRRSSTDRPNASSRKETTQVLQIVSGEAWRVEDRFSRYLHGNVVHRINGSGGEPVEVDDETARLIDFSGVAPSPVGRTLRYHLRRAARGMAVRRRRCRAPMPKRSWTPRGFGIGYSGSVGRLAKSEMYDESLRYAWRPCPRRLPPTPIAANS